MTGQDRPLLLDAYCGAGGSAKGYADAGFQVIGVDNNPSPLRHYPFPSLCADAMETLARLTAGERLVFSDGQNYGLENIAAIHASPPCQWISVASRVHRNNGKVYPELLMATRFKLACMGKPYVLENVPPAKHYMYSPVELCGSMFDLGVIRHRCFEASVPLNAPEHQRHIGKIGDGHLFSVAGGAGRWKSWGTVYRNVSKGTREEWSNAMGIDWMNRDELTQAIPPAYCKFLGTQLFAYLRKEKMYHV